VISIEIDGVEVEIAIWDTYGQEDFDRLRPLSYPESALIVICFAINYKSSFHSIGERWIPEILFFCSKPKVPLLLVGCKSDLRKGKESGDRKGNVEEDVEEVTAEEGCRLAEDIEAVGYMECSSRTREGIQDVLEKVARVVISWNPQRPRPRSQNYGCIVL